MRQLILAVLICLSFPLASWAGVEFGTVVELHKESFTLKTVEGRVRKFKLHDILFFGGATKYGSFQTKYAEIKKGMKIYVRFFKQRDELICTGLIIAPKGVEDGLGKKKKKKP